MSEEEKCDNMSLTGDKKMGVMDFGGATQG